MPTSHSSFNQARELLDMIKFEHTVFALPFAFLGALGAAQGIPPLRTILWILAAMVGARTAAMTFNRLVDTDIDAENPRTAGRALPAGRVSRAGAMALMGAGIVLFGVAAGALGPLTWALSPLALVIILGYSLCKRFTSWAHLALGLALSGAPLGAWIAVAGRIEPPALWLSGGVLAWTAGFDILYALQDQDYDRSKGLHSVPARLGTSGALALSRAFHLLALAAWAMFNLLMGSHVVSWAGWATVATMLAREQWLVRGGDLSRIDQAFFTLNSLVGLVFFLGHALEWWLSRSLLMPI
ncbi:UbiA-like polyprenyltransferase [Geothrix edaphica]|uniref:4-hydroxybenzoate octaprenyltransferase n=1 Tax=Geothrix edaphica TaxID=2927976 RepID=A0ABQ5PXN5_9BACT|nr:UbiA-like polyprenyltransferase [Geothrix edaphica]GLH66821.1 4-hydroxybenzoate octaprenyltransferase [Geothrix edaphica]